MEQCTWLQGVLELVLHTWVSKNVASGGLVSSLSDHGWEEGDVCTSFSGLCEPSSGSSCLYLSVELLHGKEIILQRWK